MATQIVNSRRIFIDTEINTHGNQGKAKIVLPPSPFSVCCNDVMRLTLLSFDMRKNWYNVNPTNNTFYIYTPSPSAYQTVTITPGSYTSMTTLETAIQDALQLVLGSATCTWSAATRKFTIALVGADPAAYIVCFQVKTGTRPTGVSDQGFFSDVHEILGAIPSRTATPVSAYGGAGSGAVTAPFPGALNTLEAIYLRTSLMGGNYQTYGLERYLPDQHGLTESQILARIPLTRACFDDVFPFIAFEDSNDSFAITLQHKHLTSFELYVTDDKGRLLAEVDPRQADLGLMAFTCTLRWDHLKPPPPPAFQPQLSLLDGTNNVPTL